jgi:RimJ/RimL family protein N-acetyltransferase
MLHQITENPFINYPELLDIWPHRKNELLRDIKDCLDNPNLEKMFFIMNNNRPIGITGFYQYDENVGLNWHGILKEYRKSGFGLAALNELIPLAIQHYPNARYLIEELPANREEEELKSFFLKAGFQRTNNLVDKPWITSETDWIEYRLLLN